MPLRDVEGGLAAPRQRVLGGRSSASSCGSRASTHGSVPRIGCLVLLFALISPRLALFVLFLFSDLLSRAFDSWIVPFLGFFLLPWTTLAYAAMWASSNGVNGFEWFIVVLAFLIDLGAFAGGGATRAAADAARAVGASVRPLSERIGEPDVPPGEDDEVAALAPAAAERRDLDVEHGMKATSARLTASEKRLW